MHTIWLKIHNMLTKFEETTTTTHTYKQPLLLNHLSGLRDIRTEISHENASSITIHPLYKLDEIVKEV